MRDGVTLAGCKPRISPVFASYADSCCVAARRLDIGFHNPNNHGADSIKIYYLFGLVQDCSISSALAMGILQFCTQAIDLISIGNLMAEIKRSKVILFPQRSDTGMPSIGSCVNYVTSALDLTCDLHLQVLMAKLSSKMYLRTGWSD